jgi:hypothetical protein
VQVWRWRRRTRAKLLRERADPRVGALG